MILDLILYFLAIVAVGACVLCAYNITPDFFGHLAVSIVLIALFIFIKGGKNA